MKIAVDAGHGSNTAGKRTPDGYKEHWANVAVAVILDQELIRCGFETYKVGFNDDDATDDTDTALKARQSLIKTNGCEAEVSVHHNASGDGKSYNSGEGVCTYYYSGATESGKFATAIQNQLISGTTQKNRGVLTNQFAMTNNTKMGTKVSALCELAFMTNKRESELLQTKDFNEECAVEIAKGICEYYGVTYVEKQVEESVPSNVPTTKYRVRKPDYTDQIGAFNILENAIEACKPGYCVFDENKNVVYPISNNPNTTITEAIEYLNNGYGFQLDTSQVTRTVWEYTRKALQNEAGVTMDGVIGPVSEKAIAAKCVVKNGSVGDKARLLQCCLILTGRTLGKIDGQIGSQTIAALKDFQKAEKLTVDGICGVQTWIRLTA